MKYVKFFCVLLVIAILVVGMSYYKPPLKNVTQAELDSIYGISYGGIIAERINDYIMNNPNCKVEDLRVLKGVDDMIISQLKERFR